MAVVLQTLKDSDFEHVVKVTTTGTNSAASIVDASALAGADTNPRLSIVSCTWTVGSQTDILFDATSDVVALSLHGNGNINGAAQHIPSIANNAGSGVTGDIQLTNSSASVGTIILHCRKVSGYDNIT